MKLSGWHSGIEGNLPSIRDSRTTPDHLGIKSETIHIDITSFHVDGKRDLGDGGDMGRILLTKNYSRDHRPDLNPVVLELMCENKAGIPVFMRPLDGNIK